MAVPTYMQGVQMSFLDTARTRHKAQLEAAAKAAPKTQVADATDSARTDSKDDSKNSGFSFDDALDIINPLQHLPIVSTIYRQLTGDTIKPLERIAGDTLFGGVPGFMSSLANLAFEKFTGKDFGDTAMALLGMDSDSQTQIAAVDITPGKTLDAQSTVAVADNTFAAPVQPTTVPAVVAEPVNAKIVTAQRTDQTVTPAAKEPASPLPMQAMALAPQSIAALTQSMQNNGIDSDLGLRALTAYQKMLNDPKLANQAPAALH